MSVITARIAGVALCLGAAGLAGCDRNTVTATARVELEEASDVDRGRTAVILSARFNEIEPSMFSSVEVKPAGQRDIELVFRGTPPTDDDVRYYASTRGILRIAPADSPFTFLVTDRDVQSVTASEGTLGHQLDLLISERAGERMLQYTRRNQGKILVTTWDGDEPHRALIQGVFSRQFQTTGFDRETAIRRKIVLQFGRLPVAVRNVEIAHPAS